MENKPPKCKLCSSSFMYNTLQDYRDKVLIIDTRYNEFYIKSHIKGSLTLNVERVSKYLQENNKNSIKEFLLTNLNDILQESESLKFSQRKRCFCFIIGGNQCLPDDIKEIMRTDYKADFDYDDFFTLELMEFNNIFQSTVPESHSEKESYLNSLQILECLVRDKVAETYLLIDGMTHFFNYYPFLNNCQVSEFPKGSFRHCNDIYRSRLYLSSYDVVADVKIVKEMKVTHILNATTEKECQNVHQSFISYLRIDILDEEDKLIYKHFQGAYEFIDNALSENENNVIVIHCAQGKSRSATLTIMYLMKKLQWIYDKAFNYVKRKRLTIQPNHGFVDQLTLFEKSEFDFDILNKNMNKE